jgi:hypothetical protein
LILSGIAAVPSVATVSVVHEQMHERTGEERKPYEGAKDVRAVFGKEQRAGDDEKSKHHKSRSRCQEAALLTFMIHMVVHRHRALLFDNQTSAKHVSCREAKAGGKDAARMSAIAQVKSAS